MRTADKQAVDLLAEDEQGGSHIGPKLLIAGGGILVAGLAGLFFVLTGLKQPAAPDAQVVAPPTKEDFLESKQAINPTPQAQVASYVPPPPRVFLPTASLFNFIQPNSQNETRFFTRKSDSEIKGQKYGLGGAKLTNFKLPDGKFVCAGKIVIFNRSFDNIIDFNLTLVNGNQRLVVKPFMGDLETREPLMNRVVHAKEKLTVPILIEGYKGRPGAVTGRIKMVATLDSTPEHINDEVKLSGK